MSGERRVLLVRPSIPPLAWMTCGVWAGVLCAEWVSWRVFGGGLASWRAAVVPIVAAAGAAVAWRARRAVVTLVLVGAVAGGVAGGLCWGAWRRDVAGVVRARGDQVLITAADASEGRFGASVAGSVTDEQGVRRRVEARFSQDMVAPELGAATEVVGTVKPVPFDDRGRGLHRDGVVGTLSVRRSEPSGWAPGMRGAIGRARLWCVERVRSVPGDGGALLSGVALGDRRRLTGTSAEADFRTTGLSHLVAVSGSHLVVVAALIAWGLARLRTRRAVSVTAMLVVMAAYVVATGMQASAIRALVMAGVAVGAGSGGRRADRAAALAAAATVALVVWPPVAFDLGFALSVASVAGLIVFARFGSEWLKAAVPRRAEWLAEPLSLTVVAQAATFPIAAPVFGVVSLVAPLANLIVGPIVALILVVGLGGLALGVVNVAAGEWVLLVAGAASALAVWVAGRLAGMPAAAVPVGEWGTAVAVGVVFAGVVLWATWPRPDRAWARLACLAAALCLAAAAVGPAPRSGAEVVVLDVGQGDAILIRDGPHAALVDTGPDAPALRRALARHGIRDLEWVAFTHSHDDHTGGARALVGAHRVGALLVSSTSEPLPFTRAARDLRAPVKQLRAGQRITVGSVAVTVLWPRQPVADSGENDASLVLLVESPGVRVLLTGDAEGDVLDSLARAAVLPDVDVLKVGHHGSRVSLTPAVLDALQPELAVISVGAGNRFGHPTPAVLELLRRARARVLRTDLDGDAEVVLR